MGKSSLQIQGNQSLTAEMKCVDKHFNNEVQLWKNNFTINLLILAEAPLSCDKYFYNRIRGQFLSGLRRHLGVSQQQLLSSLRKKGIFVLDMYKYPVATFYYDQDKRTHKLFDPHWFCKRLQVLNNAGLIKNGTKAVFRYKKLLDRYLDMGKQGINIPCLDAHGKIVFLTGPNSEIATLNEQERPSQVLSGAVVKYLNELDV